MEEIYLVKEEGKKEKKTQWHIYFKTVLSLFCAMCWKRKERQTTSSHQVSARTEHTCAFERASKHFLHGNHVAASPGKDLCSPSPHAVPPARAAKPGSAVCTSAGATCTPLASLWVSSGRWEIQNGHDVSLLRLSLTF